MKKRLVGLFIIFGISFTFAIETKLLEHWQKTMKFGISSQRSSVIKAIEDNKVSEGFGIVQEALVSDPSPDVRGQAAYAMITLKLNSDKPWLAALSSETNNDVLRKVVFGVSELKIKSAGPKLYEIVTNKIKDPKESYITATLIRALGDLEYKQAQGFVLEALTNIEYSGEVRSAAAIAMGSLGGKDNIPLLQSILVNTGENKDVRMYAGYAIGKTGDSQAFTILSPFIENETEDLNVRLWAISGLAYIKSADVTENLIRYSRVDNIRIRLEAVKALGKAGSSPQALDILKFKAFYDPDPGVQKEAAAALKAQGVDVEKLKKELNDNAKTASSSASASSSPASKSKAQEIKSKSSLPGASASQSSSASEADIPKEIK